MKIVNKTFKKNGLNYNLLQRTDKWCFFETEYSYEVVKVYLNKGGFIPGEILPSNERFGKDGSKCWNKNYYSLAKEYFDTVTKN